MALYGKRYEKIRPLGRGATGRVELVKDIKTGSLWALKLLNLSYGSQNGQTRTLLGFQQEFSLLKDLNHPSIARVHDAGFDDDAKRHYIVTEYVPGQDLMTATQDCSFDEIEDLFVQSLRALNFIHAKGVFHFDIKPENLLVALSDRHSPQIKLIDFGFGNVFERISSSLNEGEEFMIIGSAFYVAPEIVSNSVGSGGSHDGRADLYSLACAFYEALTRQPPFQSARKDVHEIHHKHIHDEPRDPRDLNPDIPGYLSQILLKLMNKNPDDRYATGAEVIKDLNWLSGRSYQVETDETNQSYVLDHGKMIGREKEFQKFVEDFEERLLVEDNDAPSYLLVHGEDGCGKSRFLSECVNEARRHFTHVMSWFDFKDEDIRNVPMPCLIIGDDVLVTPELLDDIVFDHEFDSLFFVLTTHQKKTPRGSLPTYSLGGFYLGADARLYCQYDRFKECSSRNDAYHFQIHGRSSPLFN